MSHVLVVDSSADVTVRTTGDLTHLCPFKNEVDHGTVAIVWRALGKTYELHSLAEYLQRFKDCEMSHEAITDRIRSDLSVVVGIDLVSVETTWHTAGLSVTCESRVPLPEPTGMWQAVRDGVY